MTHELDAVRHLVDEVKTLKRELRNMQRSTNLGRSSIDSGALVVTDADGAVSMSIGTNDDGTTTVDYLAGPTPGTPTVAVLTPVVGALVVTWDGKLIGPDATESGAPADFQHVGVYVTQDLDPDNPEPFDLDTAELAGVITSAAGGSKTVGLDYGRYEVRLVATTLSGAHSEPSTPATADVEQLIDSADLAPVLSDLDTRLEDARAQLVANDGQLAELRNRFVFSAAAPTPADATGRPEGTVWTQTKAGTTDGTTLEAGRWQLRAGVWTPMGLDPTVIPELLAYLATFQKVNVGQLVATSAVMDQATVLKLFTELFTAKKITAEELEVTDLEAVNVYGADIIGSSISIQDDSKTWNVVETTDFTATADATKWKAESPWTGTYIPSPGNPPRYPPVASVVRHATAGIGASPALKITTATTAVAGTWYTASRIYDGSATFSRLQPLVFTFKAKGEGTIGAFLSIRTKGLVTPNNPSPQEKQTIFAKSADALPLGDGWKQYTVRALLPPMSSLPMQYTFGVGVQPAIDGATTFYVDDTSVRQLSPRDQIRLEYNRNGVPELTAYSPSGVRSLNLSGNTLASDGGLNIQAAAASLTPGARIEMSAAGDIWFKKGPSTGLASIREDGRFVTNGTYGNTSTGTANLGIVSNGFIYRSTSRRDAKLAIEDFPTSHAGRLLDVPVRTWFDRSDSERLAAYTTALTEGEDVGEMEVPDQLRRVTGVVAEEVEAAGLPELVTYQRLEDGTQRIEGVAYDRLALLLIPIVREQRDQIAALARRLDNIEGGSHEA